MVSFTRAAYDAVVDHAREAVPNEACGVLGGVRREDDESANTGDHVTQVYPAANAAETPRTRYRIRPEAQLELLDAVDDDGLAVIGFYHSHPSGPARPSETDIAQATWVDHAYAICALDGHPFVGSWRWRGGERGFEAERVAIRE